MAVLGCGCDCAYPAQNAELFQRIVDAGGAVVSEQPWGFPPRPYAFRSRNRIIWGVSEAVLVVESGLASGTLSLAEDAMGAGRDVLAVPGGIDSPQSAGPNRLIEAGARIVYDDASFMRAMDFIFPDELAGA